MITQGSCAIALTMLVCTVAAAGQYQFTDLGSLTPPNTQTNGSWGQGINNAGAVVGRSQTDVFTFSGFQWSSGSISSLGADPVSGTSDAFAISNTGVIAGGTASTGVPGQAFYYSPVYWSVGQMNVLPVGGSSNGIGQARAISQNGQYIAGDIQDTHGTNGGALWTNGALAPITGMTFGFGVNDSGQMVGQYHDNTIGDIAVEYSNGSLLTLFGGAALAINNAGEVVGWSRNLTSQYGYPVLYKDGVATQIGPESPYSRALGINNSGVVIGMYAPDYNVLHAFVYQNGVFSDLNDIASAGPGAEFESADAINDLGQITGRYLDANGDVGAYLLTPDPSSPAPEPATLGWAIAAGVLRRSRRRR
jgi:probable HAF family extracellular repeat protein